MAGFELENWVLATGLLDEILRWPQARQDEIARRLGDDHQVASELQALLRGLRCASLLDEPLACQPELATLWSVLKRRAYPVERHRRLISCAHKTRQTTRCK